MLTTTQGFLTQEKPLKFHRKGILEILGPEDSLWFLQRSKDCGRKAQGHTDPEPCQSQGQCPDACAGLQL